jgi:hypothetical protein
MSETKVGFIIHDDAVPAWYHQTIAAIIELKKCSFCFIKMKKNEQPVKAPIAYHAFRWLESIYFRSGYDALAAVSIDKWLFNSKESALTIDGYKLKPGELQALKDLHLDLIYAVDFNSNQDENISEASVHGLWYVQFSDGNFPGFTEVMEQKAVAEIRLMIRKAGKDRIIYEGTTPVVPFSVKNNFNSMAWKASSFFPYRLMEFIRQGPGFYEHHFQFMEERNGDSSMPGNLRMVSLILKNFKAYLSYKMASVKKGRFTLLYAKKSFDPLILGTLEFIKMELPQNRFWADPFLIEKDGADFIFFEEWDDNKQKAHISVMEIGTGNASGPTKVIEAKDHLSYPFVFLHEGAYYMVPEHASSETVELYRATKFPYEWEKVMNLVEGEKLLDATLLFREGKWWMFAAKWHHPFASTNDQLFLYYSNDLFSAHWTPHPQNPVVTHAASSRPAGRIFSYGGKLYRPSQDNASRQYGAGIRFNEITLMNESQYSEKEAFSFPAADLGLLACHHIDFTGSKVVIDGIPKE